MRQWEFDNTGHSLLNEMRLRSRSRITSHTKLEISDPVASDTHFDNQTCVGEPETVAIMSHENRVENRVAAAAAAGTELVNERTNGYSLCDISVVESILRGGDCGITSRRSRSKKDNKSTSAESVRYLFQY